MKNAPKKGTLQGIKARDLMVSDVQVLAADALIEEAIETLEEYHISGAPVVDSSGRLLGVLTASDIARREHVSEGRLQSASSEYFLMNPLDEERGEGFWDNEEYFSQADYSPEILGQARVRDWMNPNIVAVGPDADVKEVCRIMVHETIHRVLVVEGGVVKGIISSFDLVRFLAEHG